MYRLIGRLEQGDLAELLRAERVETGEAVVVKLFHERTTDAAYARVIAQVARSLSPLHGQRIAHVLELGLVGGRLAIVRQDTGWLTLGTTLQRLNTREVVLPSSLALLLTLELLEVLGAAHAAGVVHGALTPGNVLLSAEGLPSIAEFGALAALQASAALRAAFAGRGRNSYRAPELKSSLTEATAAADLYAVAAIAYELLTLREASTGAAVMSTRMAKVPPPSRLVRRLNSRIDPIIMRALEASPSRRQKSVLELADALREFLAVQGGLPQREDLKKFVGELFPNEVQAGQLAPPPFDTPFSLEPLGDVGPLAVETEPARPRSPFSGGEVDATTPTSDGLPVFTDEALEEAEAQAKTITELPQQRDAGAPREVPQRDGLAPREVPQRDARAPREVPQRDAAAPAEVSQRDARAPAAPRQPEARAPVEPPQQREAPAPASWDAPEGPSPEVLVEASSNPEALRGRVRQLEAFDVSDGVVGARPVARPEEARRTVTTFALDFPREGQPEYVDYELRRQRGLRQVQLFFRVGIFILLATIFGMVWGWYRATPDPRSEFLSYLPAPIARQLGSRPPPMLPARPGPRLVLPDFDLQHKDAGPAAAPPAVVTRPEPSPRADCFVQAHGKAAMVIVTGQNLKLEIDGVQVCGSLARVSVPAGGHQLKLTDLTTHQAQVTSAHFEPGQVLRLSATTGRSR